MRRAMAAAAASVALVGGLVLALLAPVAGHDAPVPLSDAEVRSYADRLIAATWVSTGLPGTQPQGVLGELERPDPTAASNPLLDCMAAAGHPESGFAFGESEGYVLSDSDGISERSDAVLRAWYGCVVRHPVDSLYWSDELTSDSERQWERRYQLNWIAPCVMLHGYPVDPPPAEPDVDGGFPWSAYDSVWTTETTPERMDRVLAQCGDTRQLLAANEAATVSTHGSEKDAEG